jgi:hypothetical protein
MTRVIRLRSRLASARAPGGRWLELLGFACLLCTCAASTANASGIWLDPAEVLALPTSGPAWEDLAEKAQGSWGSPDIATHTNRHDVLTYAGALYSVRTGDTAMRDRVIAHIEWAMGTETGSAVIGLARNLPAYVLAADLVDYREPAFESWLANLRNQTMSDGRSLVEMHEDRPQNLGTEAGAARIAISLYLGDAADVARAADVFHGWLGNRDVYSGFDYGDLEWQADPLLPVGINPLGATRDGRVFDGIIPDDLRRCECSFDPALPFPQVNYVWEALQGAVVQAELLKRAGHPAWEWEDQALYRALRWLEHEAFFPAVGDDEWVPFLVNAAYGASFCTQHPGDVSTGKLVGFTDWTHPAPPGVVRPPDADGDCIPDDGDGSGVAGDTPCAAGALGGCDDNCPLAANYDQVDSDGDGVPDACDSCSEVANPSQDDTNADGYGDLCDPDLDDDGVVGGPDFGRFIASFNASSGEPEFDPAADFDGNGNVGGPDFGIFLGGFATALPGPSGLPCAGSAPCPDFPRACAVTPEDPDADCVASDGGGSGVVGDEPCPDRQTLGCDDNCPATPNFDQKDSDSDGSGDGCDT